MLTDRYCYTLLMHNELCSRETPSHYVTPLPHPSLSLNTRNAPPRFLVPPCRWERDDKRPLVAYTQILNELSNDEWKKLKLPSPQDVVHRLNVQLPDLLDQVSCEVEPVQCTVVENVGTGPAEQDGGV